MHKHLKDGDEGCNDYDIGRDSYGIRNHLLQQGDEDVGQCQDKDNSQSHAYCIGHLGLDSQSRTHSKHDHENRIFLPDSLTQFLYMVVLHLPTSLAQSLPSFRAFETPLKVTVAPLTRAASSPGRSLGEDGKDLSFPIPPKRAIYQSSSAFFPRPAV